VTRGADEVDLVADDHDADESEGQVMLCTYDKVQRVKNKWKCTINGVFIFLLDIVFSAIELASDARGR
jgi:hypothetical protein